MYWESYSAEMNKDKFSDEAMEKLKLDNEYHDKVIREGKEAEKELLKDCKVVGHDYNVTEEIKDIISTNNSVHYTRETIVFCKRCGDSYYHKLRPVNILMHK